MLKEAIILIILIVPLSIAIECDGCILGNKCIKIGTQRLTEEGGYEIYCSEDKTIERAKEDNAPCEYNYECISYYCDGVCTKQIAEKKLDFTLIITISMIVLLIVGLFIIFNIIKTKTYEKKKEQEPIIIRQKQIKSRYDKLEKDLKKSFERFKKF